MKHHTDDDDDDNDDDDDVDDGDACLPASSSSASSRGSRSSLSLRGTLMWFSSGGMKAATVLLDTSDPHFFFNLHNG